jgi:NADPH:quinone reductase
MRAFALEELGAPGSIVDVPVPEPAEGQVRIRVAAAGLNPFDSAVIQGNLKDQMEHRFPLVPGADASGTVDAVGEGFSGWSIGDEVFGSVGTMYLGEGTFAQFATMSTGTIARKPAAGDVVDAVRSLAADGVDVIAEMHGGDDTARLAELVRPGGHVVSAVDGADAEALSARGIEAANVNGMVATAHLETLVGMLERGEIVSPEIRTFPLTEAVEAFDQVGSGHTRGKIVVLP